MPGTSDDLVATLRAAGCVFAEEEAALLVEAAERPDQLAELVARRVAGEPLEQVVGWAEFCGLRVVVDPGVFVPRRRTEAMAREAVALARAVPAGRAGRRRPVLRRGRAGRCGGGRGRRRRAVRRGRRARRRTLRAAEPRRPSAEVLEGDLDAPLPAGLRGRVDVLVANVPYVPTDEIGLLPAEARLHEPRVTLDGGADGLRVLARVAAAAPGWLAPGGTVLCETSERQAAAALAELAAAGLSGRVVHDEDLGATVVLGTR